MVKFCVVALLGCAQVKGRFESPGEVYRCGPDDLEYCYDGPAEELSEELNLWCRPSTFLDRLATGFGCWYHCTPEPGCNAHQGCYCP